MNRTSGRWAVAGWLMAIVFALIGQFYMSSVQTLNTAELVLGVPRDGLIFYALAIVLFLVLAAYHERGTAEALLDLGWWPRLRAWADSHSVRIVLVIAALATAYTNVRYLQSKAGPVSYWDAFALWLAGGALYVAAFAHPPRVALRDIPGAVRDWLDAQWSRVRANSLEAAALAGILLIAFAARFIALGAIPDIVSGDEGRIGSLGLAAINGEIVDPFITTFGHSTMYLYAEGAALKLFGTNSPFGLRVLHAVAGTLTVVALYALGRQMFDRRVALTAAALLAVSHFHIHFSRIIVAAGVIDGLMTAIAVFFFIRGLQTGRTLSFVLAGLTTALHLYLYMGGRLVILFLLAYIVALYVVRPKLARPNTGNFLAFVGAFVVMAAPMGLWAITQPQEFMARVNQVGIFQSGWLAAEMGRTGSSEVAILFDQFVKSMLVFNYYSAYGFYQARLPMLDYFTAVAFVLGLAYALWKATDPRFLLLHAWFWSAIVAGNMLLVLPAQAAYRILITTPVAVLFAAVALVKVVEVGQRVLGAEPERAARTQQVLLGVAGAFVVLAGYTNLRYYFVEYSPSCRYEDGATRTVSFMAQYLGTLDPARFSAYVFVDNVVPSSGIHPSWTFLSGRMTISDVPSPLADPSKFVDATKGAVFLFLPGRVSDADVIRGYYPNGQWYEFRDCWQTNDPNKLQPIAWAWVVAPPASGGAQP